LSDSGARNGALLVGTGRPFVGNGSLPFGNGGGGSHQVTSAYASSFA
jgi:hypothetical protein